MTEIKALLYPKGAKERRVQGGKHWYLYNVVVDGEEVVTLSDDPEHDMARALLAKGIKGIVRVYDGNTGRPRTIVNIEKAALRRVDSNGVSRVWKPWDPLSVSAYSPEMADPVPTTAKPNGRLQHD